MKIVETLANGQFPERELIDVQDGTASTIPFSTILIADDEPANLAMLVRILQPYYRIRAVNSGERTLRAVQSAPRPDLILLDVMMPRMDGYAVLARLRENRWTCGPLRIWLRHDRKYGLHGHSSGNGNSSCSR